MLLIAIHLNPQVAFDFQLKIITSTLSAAVLASLCFILSLSSIDPNAFFLLRVPARSEVEETPAVI